MGAALRRLGDERPPRRRHQRDRSARHRAARPARQGARQALPRTARRCRAADRRAVCVAPAGESSFVSGLPRSMVDWARGPVAAGFRAAKLEVTPCGPYAHKGLRDAGSRTEVLGAVRAAVGTDVHPDGRRPVRVSGRRHGARGRSTLESISTSSSSRRRCRPTTSTATRGCRRSSRSRSPPANG